MFYIFILLVSYASYCEFEQFLKCLLSTRILQNPDVRSRLLSSGCLYCFPWPNLIFSLLKKLRPRLYVFVSELPWRIFSPSPLRWLCLTRQFLSPLDLIEFFFTTKKCFHQMNPLKYCIPTIAFPIFRLIKEFHISARRDITARLSSHPPILLPSFLLGLLLFLTFGNAKSFPA